MAVVGNAELLAIGREAHRGEGGLREYRLMYKVLTDNPHDDANVVMTAPDLPLMYAPYITETSEDAEALVVDVDPRQHEKLRTFWIVVLQYSTDWGEQSDASGQTDTPFGEPPTIRFGSEIYQEPLPGQANNSTGSLGSDPSSDLTDSKPRNDQQLTSWSAGRGIVNSAGEPYNPPPERQASRPIVTISRNEPSFSVAYKVQYENTVNSALWCGLQPRQAWLRSIEADSNIWRSSLFSNVAILYWRVTYTFALRAETWDLQLLDFGPYYLTWNAGGIDGDEIPTISDFKTADGTPKFGLLDNSDPNEPGRKLAEGEPPQWRRYLIYREQNFNGLNINLNLSLEELKKRRRGRSRE